jgi:serine/threonine protein kinase
MRIIGEYGAYRINQEIGRGSFGKVYSAEVLNYNNELAK